MKTKLIIANCSGFYGDRFSAAREIVRGGPIDVLTGDYLAELTLAILYRGMQKDPTAGYAVTFLRQMEEILGECLDKGIRVVSNAGGLNPRGLAEALEQVADKLGLKPRIAYLDGDDLLPRLEDLQAQGETLANMDTGMPLKAARGVPVTANAYLGGWGIAAALAEGADIVVAPRVTDASLVVGPAAWKFGWRRDDWDKLAGAVAAGHLIECSTQVTGGNYAFYREVPSLKEIGFPLAEMHDDGSFVITKHPGTGGLVDVGTATAQLVYEIKGPRYPNPDVTARFDTVELSQEAHDRVRVSGVRGEPPPPTSKTAINLVTGYRNGMTVLLAGLDIEEKARILSDQLTEALGGSERFDELRFDLERTDRDDPQSNEEAVARLQITVGSSDPSVVGRAFSSKVVEMALATVPGFKLSTPPTEAVPTVSFWPALVHSVHVAHRVHIGGKMLDIEPTPGEPSAPDAPAADHPATQADAPTECIAFGRLFGARSGDKGGSANLGVWARSDETYAFLREYLTVDQLKVLLADLAGYKIERYDFPNLLAVNFYIEGLLGEGAISSDRFDPQAKTLGEYLRAKVIEVPVGL